MYRRVRTLLLSDQNKTDEAIAMELGIGERKEDSESQRKGACNLFVAVEPLRGWRQVDVTHRRGSADFAARMRQLVDEDYPDRLRLRCVLIKDRCRFSAPVGAGIGAYVFSPEGGQSMTG